MAVPTSYSKFKYDDLEASFGLKITDCAIFSEKPTPINPSEWLLQSLGSTGYPILSEKSRSELYVTPILLDILRMNKSFTIFSGYQFDVDKSLGLRGTCDFLLSNNPNRYYFDSPFLIILQAKKNVVLDGIPECIAQMYATQLFNKKRNNGILTIHGIVTSGTAWHFLRLKEDNNVEIQNNQFYLSDLKNLLGALQTVIDFYKN
jgi:hypothetical protein